MKLPRASQLFLLLPVIIQFPVKPLDCCLHPAFVWLDMLFIDWWFTLVCVNCVSSNTWIREGQAKLPLDNVNLSVVGPASSV